MKVCKKPYKSFKEMAGVIKEIISDQLVTRQYLDLSLAELKSGMIKRVAGLLIGQTAAIIALIKLL